MRPERPRDSFRATLSAGSCIRRAGQRVAPTVVLRARSDHHEHTTRPRGGLTGPGSISNWAGSGHSRLAALWGNKNVRILQAAGDGDGDGDGDGAIVELSRFEIEVILQAVVMLDDLQFLGSPHLDSRRLPDVDRLYGDLYRLYHEDMGPSLDG